MDREQYKKESKILREFKDNYAKEMEIPGVSNWYEYKVWCDSNGFDESEVGYDDLMIEYVLYRLNVFKI